MKEMAGNKEMRMKQILFLGFFLIMTALWGRQVSASANWLNYGPIIHGCGSYQNCGYTNSVEALINTIENNKMRTALPIEVDFMMTSDKKLVCTHDWPYHNRMNKGETAMRMSFARFKESHTDGGFTPLTGWNAVHIMTQSPNTYLVVDTKEKNISRVYKELVNICKTSGHEKFLDRVIVQIYHFSEYRKVKKIYPFKHYIYAAYKVNCFTPKAISRLMKKARRYKMEAIKLPVGVILDKITFKTNEKNLKIIRNQRRLPVLVHAVKKQWIADILRKNGIENVYTDSLSLRWPCKKTDVKTYKKRP